MINMISGVRPNVTLVVIALIMSGVGMVAASGNISTTSGNIYLSPQGNVVLPANNFTTYLGTRNNMWASVYSKYVSIGAFAPVDNFLYFDNYWGTGDTYFILQSPPTYSVIMDLRPAGGTRRATFRFDDTISSRRGMLLQIFGDDDKAFLPYDDNSYNLGSPSLAWKNVYARNLTLTQYAGSGNAYACFDSSGRLYRSQTACA